jgi:hypothetical protein
LNDEVKEDEMDSACSTNGIKEKCIYIIGGKAGRKGLELERGIILRWALDV